MAPPFACGRRTRDRCTRSATSTTAAETTPACSRATTAGIGAASLPGVRIATATCSTSSATAAKGRSAIRTRASSQTPFPSDCIIRRADFPWHESGFVTPAFHDLVIYQLHVGAFFTPNLPAQGRHVPRRRAQDSVSGGARRHGDPAACRSRSSRPSSASATTAPTTSRPRWISPSRTPRCRHMSRRSTSCSTPGASRATAVEDLRGEMNQLKALVDLCHLHGLAVILDVVYNHAGGDFGDESLYFFDRQATGGGPPQLAVLHRQGACGRPRVRLRQAGGARLPHPEREVLARRVPRRRLPLRPGQRHRPRRRAARLALLPGPHLDAPRTIGQARSTRRSTGT